MKIKTHELTGPVLDWAVAKIKGLQPLHHYTFEKGHHIVPHPYYEGYDFGFTPSTNWEQGGPIIEREGIALVRASGGPWQATKIVGAKAAWAYGATALEAAARCYVAFKLGDEVEIPEELA